MLDRALVLDHPPVEGDPGAVRVISPVEADPCHHRVVAEQGVVHGLGRYPLPAAEDVGAVGVGRPRDGAEVDAVAGQVHLAPVRVAHEVDVGVTPVQDAA